MIESMIILFTVILICHATAKIYFLEEKLHTSEAGKNNI